MNDTHLVAPGGSRHIAQAASLQQGTFLSQRVKQAHFPGFEVQRRPTRRRILDLLREVQMTGLKPRRQNQTFGPGKDKIGRPARRCRSVRRSCRQRRGHAFKAHIVVGPRRQIFHPPRRLTVGQDVPRAKGCDRFHTFESGKVVAATGVHDTGIQCRVYLIGVLFIASRLKQ